MKHYFLTLILIPLIGVVLKAQKDEGVILFEERINLHRSIPEEDAEMKAMVPEFRVAQSELLFTKTESLYRNIEEEEEDEDMGGNGMVMRIQRPESIFYRNFATGRKTDLRDMGGERYLVEGELDKTAWKMTGESKTILGYNCLKATTRDTVRNRDVTAWFTDALPLSSGPAQFYQLPGMVLAVDINNGEYNLTALKVDFRKLKKGDMEVPTKGKKMTQAEFDAMMAATLKANGGKAMRVIKN
ncbi:MAG: GLPGLI family protein [Saprospiraceae bacterium]|nr:GLPGLI family protein [Saprospiraceae bacterium]